ncbi:uncharacterized protein LOC143201600 [Rhynchophorus ferrugineus]|uniref:Gustatory receptor n=1 Tax=Rhynchophorus ferrugineus TaxID=354439 RepID=A0A834M182_RHYFE|nr:hypothetical protein GWI33_018616 [Rhynchophorus ferrugineus]
MSVGHFFSKSFDALNPLMVLCTLFCVCPSVYPKNGPSTIIVRLYKIYGFFYCVISVVLAIVLLFLKDKLNQSIPYSVHVSDYFVHCALVATCVTMITSLVLGRTKGLKLKKIFRLMQNIDDKLGFDISVYKAKFYLGMLFYIALMVVYVVYDAFTWITFVGWDWYLLYLPKSIYICQLCLALLLPMIVLKFTYLRVKKFNRTLRCLADVDLKTLHLQAKDMSHMHTTIYDIIIQFNKVFGAVCFVGTLMVVGLIVHYVLMLLVFFEFQSELEGLKKKYVLAQCITGIILPFTLIIAIANTGDKVSYEAHKTTHICLKLLNNLPCRSNQDSVEAVREELKNLALQSSFRQPTISAKRFFPINHTMLGSVISSIVSYLIVTIQFLSRNENK